MCKIKKIKKHVMANILNFPAKPEVFRKNQGQGQMLVHKAHIVLPSYERKTYMQKVKLFRRAKKLNYKSCTALMIQVIG